MKTSDAIKMVDLRGQYLAIKDEIDAAIHAVIDETSFIRGSIVGEFECQLSGYLGGGFVLGVANGTDALQIAMMAVGVEPGDEVITTPFTFIATAEAAALLGAVPVFADIDPQTFNIDPDQIESLIGPKTKAIVPVHLFGQPADMDPILAIAEKHGLAVIEDNAQAIGARYKGRPTGLMGTIGTMSFFPSKNLGCYGDGGGLTTHDEDLYRSVRKIANHGGDRKYHNEIVGVNSRLDSIQAAVLAVKLKHLDEYAEKRIMAADRYDELFEGVDFITIPHRRPDSTHVFHQYTVRISPEVPGGRDGLSAHLKESGIPHAIYYPTALHQLPVFADGHARCRVGVLNETERAAAEVLSLPTHTELTADQQERIVEAVKSFVTEGLRVR